MVFLQSKYFELSTNSVIDWLLSFNEPFIRYNVEDPIELKSFQISSENNVDIILLIKGVEINLKSIKSYWHRRGKIKIKHSENLKILLKPFFPKKKLDDVNVNLKSQIESIESYINNKLANLPISIGNNRLATVNKLTVLEYATNCGIEIPETAIISTKKELAAFKNKKNNIITKSILDSLFVWDDNENIVHYTELITDDFINSLSDTFAPSLFQEAVIKKFELRIFYLKGMFFSMAIFSQSDSQTAVDFRKYNDLKPNRTIPYLLPKEIEVKLDSLMQRLNLNTGSIDMIVSNDNKYYFLEVNPVGQFGMVSIPCNYQIEKEIALYLTK